MKPGVWDDITTLDGPDVKARLLANLDEMLSITTDADEDAGLSSLPQPLADLWYLNWLLFETELGGLTGYLDNSHGRHAILAAGALRRIGFPDVADGLEQAHAVASRADDGRRAEKLEELESSWNPDPNSPWWEEPLDQYLLSAASSLSRWALV